MLSAGFLVQAAPSYAAAPTTREAAGTSSNWAGYVATGATFSDVKGTWVQPAVSCTAGASYSSFWVGLGGYTATSSELEQIGTSSDCTSRNRVSNYAWYELVPLPLTRVALPIRAGDTMSAEVSVVGTAVTMTLTDVTTGQTSTISQTVATPDVTSAEWIAEAPSFCSQSSCRVLPLANFGSVAFSAASATANGGAASLATADSIQLVSRTGLNASPSALGADGASFTVSTAAPVLRPQRLNRWGWSWSFVH